ncbi:NAD-dependent epimerase/dehydratase family protein [Myceligenerans pegani]|uniref:NAD-dependent epimerase/dehydratase family protein n=1 Tax=Myceligenerans pegani TaxID=2776917 RepID=A0ABR9N4U9_9MICO|nr:NAD-dependent epimerase/dehydratase family protein [Myceligenerans sp. TRM 65318]MBE1878701.1 NAD-dependent epimerase/dehydratase family protein [Myceligenerans sp. TRM 65318]MBE3020972.1 NAD-dependent epimerase/dehydratase family protein [Myceligenerans sp. TRM 65318]
MRIFLAGATGVIGSRLLPLLVAAGHDVAGTTRLRERAGMIERAGGSAVVVDVYDAEALTSAVVDFRPDLVMHQLTDLPDDPAEIPARAVANARIRTEGTANVLAAARAAGPARVFAQSIAWTPPGRGDAVAWHEAAVLDAGGVVVRYGQFYGSGTYYEAELPAHPRIHVDEAARRTAPLVEASPGIVVVTDPED